MSKGINGKSFEKGITQRKDGIYSSIKATYFHTKMVRKWCAVMSKAL